MKAHQKIPFIAMCQSRTRLTGLVFLLLFAGGCCIVPHHLRRSEASLKVSLLKTTPPVCSFADVWTLAEKEGWLDRGHGTNYGFCPAYIGGPRDATEMIGVKSIRGHLGHYWVCPWRMDVTAFWGFDTDGRLIDVWIWKTADSL